MAINSYDDTKITKGGIWVTITKASCIVSFKRRHVRARLNSIFVACGNLLVYPLDVFSRIPAKKTQKNSSKFRVVHNVFLVQEAPCSDLVRIQDMVIACSWIRN